MGEEGRDALATIVMDRGERMLRERKDRIVWCCAGVFDGVIIPVISFFDHDTLICTNSSCEKILISEIGDSLKIQ